MEVKTFLEYFENLEDFELDRKIFPRLDEDDKVRLYDEEGNLLH